MTLEISRFRSPLGTIRFATQGGRLSVLGFEDSWKEPKQGGERTGRTPLREAGDCGDVASRLDAYFSGDLEALADLPVGPAGTSFQQKVWEALREIPPGRTVAYRDLARRIDAASAARAIGAACGANPIWIVIPCHRVIAADGTLGGYGGGLDRKRWLLAHEGALRA